MSKKIMLSLAQRNGSKRHTCRAIPRTLAIGTEVAESFCFNSPQVKRISLANIGSATAEFSNALSVNHSDDSGLIERSIRPDHRICARRPSARL